MGKLPEAAIEAAMAKCDDAFGDYKEVATCRTRSVILALANELPESAVRAAYLKLVDCLDDNMLAAYSRNVDDAIRAAIIAALKDVGGE